MKFTKKASLALAGFGLMFGLAGVLSAPAYAAEPAVTEHADVQQQAFHPNALQQKHHKFHHRWHHKKDKDCKACQECGRKCDDDKCGCPACGIRPFDDKKPCSSCGDKRPELRGINGSCGQCGNSGSRQITEVNK